MTTIPQVYMPSYMPPYDMHDISNMLNTLQQQNVNNNITYGNEKVIDTLQSDTRFLNQAVVDGDRNIIGDINDTSNRLLNAAERHNLGLRDAIERNGSALSSGIERTSAVTQNAIERTSAVSQNAIERVAGEGRVTTLTSDAASRQAAADSARDIQVAIERGALTNYNAVERNATEGRITTLTTDAASRQAFGDGIRDVQVSVERNGANAVNSSLKTSSDILSAVERTASETRLSAISSDGVSRLENANGIRSVMDTSNRNTNELLTQSGRASSDILSSINNNGYEGRINTSNGFTDIKNQMFANEIHNQRVSSASDLLQSNNYSNILLEQQKIKDALSSRASSDYASLLLEGQKNREQTSSQSANYFAMNQLEMQKVKSDLTHQLSSDYSSLLVEGHRNRESIASQAANHFAINQLEQQKVKEVLAAQASVNFAMTQLEQQKIKEHLSMQLADAKYEGLKHKDQLSSQMMECCCDIKTTIRSLDENRVRDALSVANNEVNLLKVFDRFERTHDRGWHDRGGYHGHYGHSHDRGGGRRD